MKRQSWAVLAVLGAILYGLQAWPGETSRRAQIVWPVAGGSLYYKGVIEVALEGLSAMHFDSLLVRVEALDAARGTSVGPITLWEGWSQVPVAANQIAGQECAWITWTDQAQGRAVLWVVWNYFPPGFRSGDHFLRVEVFFRYAGQYIGRWETTDWHRVRLVPEESPKPAVMVGRPTAQAEFGSGEPVVVRGVVANAAPPFRVRLDVRRADPTGRWESVVQRTLSTCEFEICWEASLVAPGLYHVRVGVTDARGASGVSAEVPILFASRPLQVKVTHPAFGTHVKVGEVLHVRGRIDGAAPPTKVGVEMRREVDVARWDLVGEVALREATFDLLLDTSRLAPGNFYLRATARDARGMSASSNEVCITVQERSFRIMIAGRAGEVFEVRERDPAQFGVEAEGPWVKFAWQFGDGKTSDLRAPVHIYEKPGTYKACVTALAPDGTTRTAYATITVTARQIVAVTRKIVGYPRRGCEGVSAVVHRGIPYTVRVEVTFRVLEEVTGLLLTERIPAGWRAKDARPPVDKPTDIGVQLVREPQEKDKDQEWTWMITSTGPQLQIQAGTQFVVSYTLTPPSDARPGVVDIVGEVYAQIDPDSTVSRKVAGDSRLWVETKLDVFVAILYLKLLEGTPEPSWDLMPPESNRTFLLTEEQLGIAEKLMREGTRVPYADVVLKPEDYLKLLGYFQTRRSVLGCP